MKFTKITIKINSHDKPPFFIGSQIRGAFGYALKQISQGQKSLYDEFFLKHHEIHPYRFDIKLSLKRYEFSFYLFENFCDEVFEVVCAFKEMLHHIGLTQAHKTYKNFEIFVNDELIFKDNELKFIENYIKIFTPKPYESDIYLKFITPLRIKRDNIFIIDDNIRIFDILNSIYQREQKLKFGKFQKFPYQICERITQKNIYFQELTRKSNLQKTKMSLGGIMGEIKIENLSKETHELLQLGEILGVGKSCVFGLGKIKIRSKK